MAGRVFDRGQQHHQGGSKTGHFEDLRAKDREQHFSNSVGRPLDIVKACFYLTDPDNRFVNGTNITVDL